jgi:hypothetical protein
MVDVVVVVVLVVVVLVVVVVVFRVLSEVTTWKSGSKNASMKMAGAMDRGSKKRLEAKIQQARNASPTLHRTQGRTTPTRSTNAS